MKKTKQRLATIIRKKITLIGPTGPMAAFSAIKELAHVSMAISKNEMPIKSMVFFFMVLLSNKMG